MKNKIEPFNANGPSEKNIMINNWLVYAKSIYFNGKYSYYSKVFLVKALIYKVLKMITN